MGSCNRCARCCHYIKDNKVKSCKYLKPDKTCKIYYRRLNTIIDKGVKCGMRFAIPYDFKDCPQNTNKPIRDVGY